MAGPLAERVVVSQLGARMHYAVPRLLSDTGNLEHFYTDICASTGLSRYLSAVPSRVLPKAMVRMRDRVVAGVDRDRITTFDGFGLAFALRRLRMRTASDETRTMIWGGQTLAQRVIESGFRDATAVYAFSGESLELLEHARSQGLKTAVEQIIAPRRVLDHLLGDEQARFPDWHAETGGDRYAEAFAAREKAEWAASDVVVCGSEFVRDSVIAEGGDPHRCVVVPYGIADPERPARRAGRDGPLRVATVGSVGLRKGSPYVTAAARRLAGRATFRMVGPCPVPASVRAELSSAVTLTGSVPRSEIREHLAWADVFLLPSICEGSATAVYEALAAGLPVVTTPNTGTVVRDGIDGFVVPIRDSEAIAEALLRLAGDPDLQSEMSANARNRARDYDLEHYGQRLRSALSASWTAARRHSGEHDRGYADAILSCAC